MNHAMGGGGGDWVVGDDVTSYIESLRVVERTQLNEANVRDAVDRLVRACTARNALAPPLERSDHGARMQLASALTRAYLRMGAQLSAAGMYRVMGREQAMLMNKAPFVPPVRYTNAAYRWSAGVRRHSRGRPHDEMDDPAAAADVKNGGSSDDAARKAESEDGAEGSKGERNDLGHRSLAFWWNRDVNERLGGGVDATHAAAALETIIGHYHEAAAMLVGTGYEGCAAVVVSELSCLLQRCCPGLGAVEAEQLVVQQSIAAGYLLGHLSVDAMLVKLYAAALLQISTGQACIGSIDPLREVLYYSALHVPVDTPAHGASHDQYMASVRNHAQHEHRSALRAERRQDLTSVVGEVLAKGVGGGADTVVTPEAELRAREFIDPARFEDDALVTLVPKGETASSGASVSVTCLRVCVRTLLLLVCLCVGAYVDACLFWLSGIGLFATSSRIDDIRKYLRDGLKEEVPWLGTTGVCSDAHATPYALKHLAAMPVSLVGLWSALSDIIMAVREKNADMLNDTIPLVLQSLPVDAGVPSNVAAVTYLTQVLYEQAVADPVPGCDGSLDGSIWRQVHPDMAEKVPSQVVNDVGTASGARPSDSGGQPPGERNEDNVEEAAG